MTLLLWGHAAYLVLLAILVSGCLWTAMRKDADW
jgi:hypothetical protein